MAQVPINPSILSWVMQDADIDAESVATVTGRSPELVHSWLDGTAKPTKGDVQLLAKHVGRSVQFFFLSQAPLSSGVGPKFRAAVGGNSHNPIAELTAVRTTSRLQRIAHAAAQEAQAEPVSLPKPSASASEYADIMRHHLSWTTQLQTKATSKSALFREARRRVEQLGIAVMYRDLGEQNCRGFSLTDPLAPVIAINSFYKQPALRTFTLLHELGHLANGTASMCHFEDSADERWCDAFAAAFLLPEQDLRTYFERKNWSSVSLGQMDERIKLTSNRYKASWQAVAIRLRDLGLTNEEVVARAFATNGDANDPPGFLPGGGRTTPVIRLDEYGSTFTKAVLALRTANRLSELDARRYLHVNGSELSSLRELAGGVG